MFLQEPVTLFAECFEYRVAKHVCVTEYVFTLIQRELSTLDPNPVWSELSSPIYPSKVPELIFLASICS